MDLTADSWSRADCERALYNLLQATLRLEGHEAARAAEIAAENSKIEQKFAPKITLEAEKKAELEQQIEAYYRSHRSELEQDGAHSIELSHGTIGMRRQSNPALVLINPAKFSWDKAAARVKRLFRGKYLLPPKPAINKMWAKKALKPEDLKRCGLRLEDDDRFFLELNR